MRTVIDHNLSTRAGRLRLDERKKPYFRALDTGIQIGYVRGAGIWTGRVWIDGKYVTSHKFGEADDEPGRPGASYSEAVSKVRVWARTQQEQARLVALGEDPLPDGDYLVRHAVADYLDDAERRGVKSVKKTIKPALEAHVLSTPLADVPLSDLTTPRLRKWHQAIAASAPRRRSSKLTPAKLNTGPAPETPEQRRSRKATANHILYLLKAALNRAFEDGKVASDAAWKRVKPFAKVDSPRTRYLTVQQTRALLAACSDDLRRLVAAGLLTGCRYAEIAALAAGDFDASSHTIYVAPGKNSKERHVHLTREGAAFFTRETKGKRRNELIFLRADGRAWGPSHQHRPMQLASAAAGIEPAVHFHCLRHTHASLLVQAGAPLTVVSKQLGHSSTKMSERYAHLSPTSIGDLVRASLPAFGIGGREK